MTGPLFRAYSIETTDGRTVRGAVRADDDGAHLDAKLRAAKVATVDGRTLRGSAGSVLSWHSERAYAATCSVSDIVRAIAPRSEYVPPEPAAYNVVRFYQSAAIRRRIILERVTLTEAQRHCSDPETSSSTATSAAARARTRKVGAWFDGYEAR